MDFCLLGFSKKLTGFAGLLEKDTTPKTRVGNSIIGFFLDRIPRFCDRKIHSITVDLFKKIDESDSITKRVKDRRSKDRIPNHAINIVECAGSEAAFSADSPEFSGGMSQSSGHQQQQQQQQWQQQQQQQQPKPSRRVISVISTREAVII